MELNSKIALCCQKTIFKGKKVKTRRISPVIVENSFYRSERRLTCCYKLFGNAQRTNQPEGENPSCWLPITDSSVVARHGIVVTHCREGRIANLSPKRK